MSDVEKVTKSYSEVIREARKTPLGFFSLIGLITQLVIVTLILIAPTSELLISLAIGAFVLLFLVVAGIAYVKPQVFGVNPLPDGLPAALGEDIVRGFEGALSNGTQAEKQAAYQYFLNVLNTEEYRNSRSTATRKFMSKLRKSVEENANIEGSYAVAIGVIERSRSSLGDD